MGEKPSYEGKLQYSSFSPWENGYYIARFPEGGGGAAMGDCYTSPDQVIS